MVGSAVRVAVCLAAVTILLSASTAIVLATDVQTPSCTTALLVIDVQGIWLRGPLLTVDGTHITQKTAEILPLARGAGVPVIYIKDVSESGNVPEYRLDMPSAIAPLDGDYVSEKLYGNAFLGTDLHDLLQSLGVSSILISGLASHSCVSATVNGARLFGYEVVILEDGHSGGQNGDMAERQNTIWSMRMGLAVIASSDLDWTRQCSVEASEESNEP